MTKVIARSEHNPKPVHRASGRGESAVVVQKDVPSGDGHRDPAPAEEQRQSRIAEAAYFLAERRGFACGCELDDWLLAERDIDAALAREESAKAPVRAAGPES